MDGIRGVAILLVIGRHYWLTPHGGGGAGVNLFFVLSGFLITSLLLEHRWPSLSAFYIARARRLAPALVLVLAAYLVGAAARGDIRYGLEAVGATGFYTANLLAAFRPHTPATPIPLWSLALEEQFYLVWPLLLIGLARFRRGTIAAIVAGLILADWGWRIWLTIHGAPEQRLLTSPDTHADALLAGVLIAVIPRRQVDQGLAVIAVFLFATVAFFGPIEAINGPWVDLGAVGIVWFAAQDRTWLNRWLSWTPLVWVGGISYSLYLWHELTRSWITDKPAALVVAVLAAWLSTRFVESRFRRRKNAAAPKGDGVGIPQTVIVRNPA